MLVRLVISIYHPLLLVSCNDRRGVDYATTLTQALLQVLASYSMQRFFQLPRLNSHSHGNPMGPMGSQSSPFPCTPLLHGSRFRRERGSSIPGNSGTDNDRDSRAPGKREPGNAFPNRDSVQNAAVDARLTVGHVHSSLSRAAAQAASPRRTPRSARSQPTAS